MSAIMNRQWRLAAYPCGMIKPTDFEFHSEPVPSVGEGQFLIRVVYLSLDPAIRGWLYDRTGYMSGVQIGEVVRCLGGGIVEQSRHPGFAVGDEVQGLLGWQEYSLSGGETILKLPGSPLPMTTKLGLFGLVGRTAYFGLLEIGQPREGETLLVSGAGGAVGSLAGQIGKIKGMRVVGIDGSDDKCAWLVNDVGFDAAINYKNGDLSGRLKAACPQGVDVYFDNVGGDILDAALAAMNNHGRVVACGSISRYNATTPVAGPANYYFITERRLKFQGFVAMDFIPRDHEMVADYSQWHRDGKITYRVEVVQGLEAAPVSINRVFEGTVNGKLLVHVSQEPGHGGRSV
jgi:NADPH-dependent curcumin reductase CurA